MTSKWTPDVDPIRLEVIRNALITLCDESMAILVRSAYSTNIKERRDCSASVRGAEGASLSGGRSQMGGGRGRSDLMRYLLEKFGDELAEGDIYIMNDPYMGGPTHLPDMSFLKPVFYQGELVGFVGNQGHWADVGGKAPAQGVVGDATEIFQEGLRLPPVQLYKGGKLREEIQDIILMNTRGPHEREADIRAHVAALRIAEQRLQELAQKYGVQELKRYMKAITDSAEIRGREAILAAPEGTWEAIDYIDDDLGSDEPIPIKLKITIQHTPEPQIILDFTGSGPPAKWGINVSRHGSIGAATSTLRSILDPLPGSVGFSSLLKVIMPENSIINAKPPAAVGARTESTYHVEDVVLAALMETFPKRTRAPWHGIHGVGFSSREGQPYFIHYQTTGGGGGARTFKDGIDSLHEISNLPQEPMEMQYPLRGLRVEYIQDSEGAGKFRGGVGVRVDWEMLDDVYFASHSNRHKIPARGIAGGEDGALSKIVLNYDSQNPVELPREATNYPVKKGDIVSMFAGGGAGYGDPFQRDPMLVLEDVRDAKVSLKRARDVYGVAIDTKRWTVVEEETTRLRQVLAADPTRRKAAARSAAQAKAGAK